MSNLRLVLVTGIFSLAVYAVALALGYLWARALRYPFTLRQRKMLSYYALGLGGASILNPLFVAMGRFWGVPLGEAAVLIVAILFAWIVLTFYIVRHMSKPGGRLSKERENSSPSNL